MELPHLGQQCTEKTCHKLDFLPITCDACKQIFCDEHYTYASHNCPNAYMKNNQVPVCPLCNAPIPIARGELPDQVVGAHIDNDCQSGPAKSRRQIFINKCARKGCKNKELIPVVCNDCKENFCLKHRHAQDHACNGKKSASLQENKALKAALQRQNNARIQNSSSFNSDFAISEDEQLARAIALSIQEASKTTTLSQEDLDLQLARQLHAMETGGTGNGQTNTTRNLDGQKCCLQ